MTDEKRIGDHLVDAGIITRDALEEVLRRRPAAGGERRLLSEIYSLGLASERQLAELLARRVGAPVAVLTESVIDLSVVGVVPTELMKKHLALPVAADERSVTVVTPDPDAPGIAVPLGFATGRRVVLLLGIHAVLEQKIDEALAALARGDKRLAGEHARSKELHVEVARWASSVSLEEANAIARALLETLTDAPHDAPQDAPADWEPPSKATRIGAVRLRQMVIDRSVSSGAAFVPDGSPAPHVPQIVEPRLTPIPLPPPEPPVEAFREEPAARGPPVALVVEDDDALRRMLATALRHDGLTVLEAQSGDEAVTILRNTRPGVVLLDAMLPQVHGFEICAGLKRSAYRDVPVIMISAIYRGWLQAREIHEVHGADHFIEKPFELTFVRKLVAELLKRPYAAHPSGNPGRVFEMKRRYEEHVAAGQLQEAARDVEAWMVLEPFDGRAWLERGNLLAQGGDLVGAMAAFEAAAVYEPTLLTAHLGLAMVCEQLGFVRRARVTWQRARDLATDDGLRARIDAHLR